MMTPSWVVASGARAMKAILGDPICSTGPLVIVLTHPGGHAAVAQQAHAWMCGQLARAWGNARFGVVVPAEEVCLAAEQHELGMVDWDLAPALDPDTGLPATVTRLDLST